LKACAQAEQLVEGETDPKKIPDVHFCTQIIALYILGVDVAFEVKDEACGRGQHKLYTEHIPRCGLTAEALFLKM
jgi:hypothetical protein